ncbi:DUF3168 domain-containing protein [Stakelama saccharophila]|uniref:DUF3168 domain-containing protein n=1 Tax=Stakelama saccharophila TaxID=3075605 RepID=A0ABZ0BB47_9SPHN|nr:DUF3168 domain-containing protein [Stakelama sp. W311]WNO53544.1 DUF3168 domain-containing protein [Stakelama sp. W311]
MSVRSLLQQALVTALSGDPAVGGAVTAVFDAPPPRVAMPYALVEETVLSDWGAKDVAGREGRVLVLIEDAGERPVRVRSLCDAAGAALAAMPRELGEGWRIVTMVPLRSRVLRAGRDRWTGSVEARVRLLRVS